MQVEHGLSGSGADVEDGAVSLLDVSLARDFGGGEMAASDELGVFSLGFLKPSEVFLGNHKHMRGGLRIDVLEGKNVFILVDFLRGNLAAQDAAEQAVGGRISHIQLACLASLTGTITIATGEYQGRHALT